MRLMALLLVASLLGCSSLRRPLPEVDRSQDDRILQEVEARLTAEPQLASSPIRVEVDGGLVLLYGSVEGMGAWNCAIRNAQLVDGVSSVVDYLVIDRGPRDIACLAPLPG